MLISTVLERKGKAVATIHSTDKIADAAQKLAEGRIGALVVTDRWGKLAGILSERDLVRGLASHGAATLGLTVDELMTPDVTTCSPSDRIDEIMSVMTVHRIRHLPVMEGGNLIGVVSIGDLVKYRLDEKEQEAKILRDITRALA